MQRIGVFGGRISWQQWRTVASLAAEFSPGTPLHLTTRQDIELHNIAGDDLPAIHKALAKAGLSTFGAGGDSIRNITVCPGSGICPGSNNVFPLAQLVRENLLSDSRLLDLPRKFKISFSGCHFSCAKPWITCLGFVSQRDGLFTVIGAGSLGAKPATGIELYKDLPARDVLPLCVAAIEFFAEYGDRENRRRARFRHVRENLGDDAFRAQLDTRFKNVMSRHQWPEIAAPQANTNMRLKRHLRLPYGNIDPADAIAIADAAEPAGAELRINIEHGLEIYSSQDIKLDEAIAAYELNPVVIACPGQKTCPRSLADTTATAEAIRSALASKERKEARICISGCPNGCVHSIAADIGMVGVRRKIDGVSTQCYRLFTGGGNGRDNKLATESAIVPASDVVEAVKRLAY